MQRIQAVSRVSGHVSLVFRKGMLQLVSISPSWRIRRLQLVASYRMLQALPEGPGDLSKQFLALGGEFR